MAVHIGIGNFSVVIASNIFRTQDAPRYLIGCEFYSSSLNPDLYLT